MDSRGWAARPAGPAASQVHLGPGRTGRLKRRGWMEQVATGPDRAAKVHRLAFLHISYGQRTERRERQAFEQIADFYGVRERLVVRMDHFRRIGGSALTAERLAVPEARTEIGAGDIPVTYVPFRNTHFLAVAVSWAEVLRAQAVFIGAVAEDSSG